VSPTYPQSNNQPDYVHRVQEDIIRSLKMSREHLYKAVHPFNRANLYYEIRYTSGHVQFSEIYEYIDRLHRRRGRASSGIVYCRTKITCDELTSFLRGKGMNARAYHRGIRYVHIPLPTHEKTPTFSSYIHQFLDPR
jgi:superfamily II DNA helicase RecQ